MNLARQEDASAHAARALGLRQMERKLLREIAELNRKNNWTRSIILAALIVQALAAAVFLRSRSSALENINILMALFALALLTLFLLLVLGGAGQGLRYKLELLRRQIEAAEQAGASPNNADEGLPRPLIEPDDGAWPD